MYFGLHANFFDIFSGTLLIIRCSRTRISVTSPRLWQDHPHSLNKVLECTIHRRNLKNNLPSIIDTLLYNTKSIFISASGNINEFLDLCRDYYGLPKELLAGGEFEKEEMDWFRKRTESEYFEDVRKSTKDRIEYRCRQVCITGAASPMSEILLMELFQLKVQHRKDGMVGLLNFFVIGLMQISSSISFLNLQEIRLYDEPKREKKLLATAADARYCCGPSGLGSCRVVSSLRDALIDVDLVIVLDSFSR